MSTTEHEARAPLYLEAVPPLLRQGSEGVDAILEKVEAVHSTVGLAGVNIPEIREEQSKSEKGERLKPFEPRLEPRVLARRLQETLGVDCMINRVVVHLERERQADWFRETREEFGVTRFVLVGGERSDVAYPGPSVPEANRLIRETLPADDIRVGNICIPTRAGEAARMLRKMESGADFFTTQIIYHPEEFTGLLDDLAAAPVPARLPELLLTLCPVRSPRNIKFLHWLGVSISADLEEWLTVGPETTSERSLAHIERAWAAIGRHRATTDNPFPVGISLAPIGKIPNEMTVRLARALVGG